MELKNKLIKAYEGKPPEELINSPVYALQGVSKKDADLLYEAFSIKTIMDLATLKYAQWASEICRLADSGFDKISKSEFKEKLIKKYEGNSPKQLAKAPSYALQGLSKKDSDRLKKAFNIKTIRDLAELKYIEWAREIVELTQKSSSRGKTTKISGLMKFGAALILIIIAVIIVIIYKPGADNQKTDVNISREISSDAETIKNPPAEKKIATKLEKKTDVIEKKPLPEEDNIYRVEVKDELRTISKKLLGKEALWRKIYKANRENIKDPNIIYPGQRLKIPKD